jgi:hypothetical protein
MENHENNNTGSPFRSVKERTMYLSILIDDLKIQLLLFETRGDMEKFRTNMEKTMEKIKKEMNGISH